MGPAGYRRCTPQRINQGGEPNACFPWFRLTHPAVAEWQRANTEHRSKGRLPGSRMRMTRATARPWAARAAIPPRYVRPKQGWRRSQKPTAPECAGHCALRIGSQRLAIGDCGLGNPHAPPYPPPTHGGRGGHTCHRGCSARDAERLAAPAGALHRHPAEAVAFPAGPAPASSPQGSAHWDCW